MERGLRCSLSPRFLRFLAVGGLNALVGYGLFALFTWLGLPYPLAIALATVLGVASLLHFGLNLYRANAAVIVPLAMITSMLQRTFVFPPP